MRPAAKLVVEPVPVRVELDVTAVVLRSAVVREVPRVDACIPAPSPPSPVVTTTTERCPVPEPSSETETWTLLTVPVGPLDTPMNGLDDPAAPPVAWPRTVGR